jgi:hypothetical protein
MGTQEAHEEVDTWAGEREAVLVAVVKACQVGSGGEVRGCPIEDMVAVVAALVEGEGVTECENPRGNSLLTQRQTPNSLPLRSVYRAKARLGYSTRSAGEMYRMTQALGLLRSSSVCLLQLWHLWNRRWTEGPQLPVFCCSASALINRPKYPMMLLGSISAIRKHVPALTNMEYEQIQRLGDWVSCLGLEATS